MKPTVCWTPRQPTAFSLLTEQWVSPGRRARGGPVPELTPAFTSRACESDTGMIYMMDSALQSSEVMQEMSCRIHFWRVNSSLVQGSHQYIVSSLRATTFCKEPSQRERTVADCKDPETSCFLPLQLPSVDPVIFTSTAAVRSPFSHLHLNSKKPKRENSGLYSFPWSWCWKACIFEGQIHSTSIDFIENIFLLLD